MRPPLRGQRFAVLTQAHDLIEDALGYFPLRAFGDFDNLVTGDDSHGVAVLIKTYAFP